MKNFKGRINTFWPSLIGEFQNEDHQEIKDSLISFFDEYEKKKS